MYQCDSCTLKPSEWSMARVLFLLVLLLAAGPGTGQDTLASVDNWLDAAHQQDLDADGSSTGDSGDAALQATPQASFASLQVAYLVAPAKGPSATYQGGHRIRAPPLLDHWI